MNPQVSNLRRPPFGGQRRTNEPSKFWTRRPSSWLVRYKPKNGLFSMRHRKTLIFLTCLGSVLPNFSCQRTSTPTDPTATTLEEEVREISGPYIRVGAMVGIIDGSGSKRVFSFGTKAVGTEDPPDSNTVFEIGSVTKTFTATLLAEMHRRGLLSTALAQSYLPETGVILPTRDGVPITLFHLATHQSGIPSAPHLDPVSGYPLPEGFDSSRPYSAYTFDHLYEYLSDYCSLSFTPGTWWEYSNTGVGLLGHILGRADGTSFRVALQRYVLNELGMTNTDVAPVPATPGNVAKGHDSRLEPAPDFIASDIYQGAGSIRSSMQDMLRFLEAQIGIRETPLEAAIEFSHQPVLHQGSLGEQALAWYIKKLDDGREMVYSGGDTYGYSAFVGFNKAERTGVVVLLNYQGNVKQLEMGQELLEAIHRYLG